MLIEKSPTELNKLFEDVCARDLERFKFPGYLAEWLFADRLAKRGVRQEMSFSAYEGPAHLEKFFRWIYNGKIPDYFTGDHVEALVTASAEADRKVFAQYDHKMADAPILHMARYNAQDHMFQRAYCVPHAQRVKTLLDFGAGHGRIANLSFHAPDPRQRLLSYIAVEAIPSTYFNQLAYYHALGLSVWEYLEHCDEELSQDVISDAMQSHNVVHLPTWQLSLVPDACIDMVNTIQVLKELPGPLVNYILPEFKRVTHPRGALYVRDHKQFHNPNHMPMETLIQAQGFTLEFAPQLRDRVEIHGLPRIWRKIDAEIFISNQNRQ